MRKRKEVWTEIAPGMKVSNIKYVTLTTGKTVPLDVWEVKSAWRVKKKGAIRLAIIALIVLGVTAIMFFDETVEPERRAGAARVLPAMSVITALLVFRAVWAVVQARGVRWEGEELDDGKKARR